MEHGLAIVIGLVLIVFILWWFFGKHEVATEEATVAEGAKEQTADVLVDGGYKTEVVTLKQGVPATLKFTRKDPSTCLDRVVFPDWGINRPLPEGETEEIKVDTSQAGEFEWACGMDMFHGKVIVK